MSRRELPDAHLVNQAKGRLLLDLTRMNRNLSNLKARISRDTDPAQLCSIEPAFHFIQGKSYRLTDSCPSGPAETVTRIRTYQPHEVPPSVPDLLIQCGSNNISGRRPRLIKLLLYEIEAIGQ